jgi:ATP-binding cassette subfamily B protein
LRTKGAWEQWRTLPRVRPYLRPYRALLTVSVLLTILSAAVALAEPWPLAVMVDSVLGDHAPPWFLKDIFGSEPDRTALLITVVGAGFAQVVLSHGLTVINDYVNARLEQNMVLDLRSDLFEHCQRLSLTFHDSRATGRLMSQINLQAHALGAIVMAFPPIAQSVLMLIGMLVIALLIDWQVTLIALVAIPFIYYALGLYGTRIVPRIKKVQRLEWRSLSIVYEAMAMLRVIVPFGRETYEHRRFRTQGQTAVDERVKLTVRQTLFGLGVSAATAAGTALVLGFGAWHVLRGDITIGELLVLMSYIAAVYHPLESISATLGDMHQQFVYLNASFSLLDKPQEVKEARHAMDIERSRGELTFEVVNFAYKGRSAAVRDVSFEVSPGQRVAIVGPTGAGKTTLVNLIVRFYDPRRGRILLDGIDIRRLSLKSLRAQIALVLQEPVLFSGTIAQNIRYGRLDAGMEEIVQAAKAANAHDFISALPEAYETQVGERGAQLSGGERQRIALARAFIKDAPLLVLDEPTSSIDSKTENVILDAMEELMVGRTSILVAHRLSTIRDADLILVMNQGQLVEQGTHDALLARGGLYRQLHDAQSQARARAKVESEPARAQAEEVAKPAPKLEPPTTREPVLSESSSHGRAELSEPEPETRRARLFRVVKEARHLGDRDVACDICGRALLKSEEPRVFLVPAGNGRLEEEQKLLCELCQPKARREGWTAVQARTE